MSKSAAKQSPLMLALLPLVILYVCAVVLVALSREDLGGTLSYWEFFIPIVAVISLISGWGNAYVRGQWSLFYLIRQILSWGLFVGMLWLLQEQGVPEALGDQKTTLTLVFLLALVSVLVGMQLDWKLFVFGVFLAICAYLLADPAHVAMLTPIGDRVGIEDAQSKPLTMIIGMGTVAFVISLFILLSMRGAIMAKRVRSS